MGSIISLRCSGQAARYKPRCQLKRISLFHCLRGRRPLVLSPRPSFRTGPCDLSYRGKSLIAPPDNWAKIRFENFPIRIKIRANYNFKISLSFVRFIFFFCGSIFIIIVRIIHAKIFQSIVRLYIFPNSRARFEGKKEREEVN